MRVARGENGALGDCHFSPTLLLFARAREALGLRPSGGNHLEDQQPLTDNRPARRGGADPMAKRPIILVIRGDGISNASAIRPA